MEILLASNNKKKLIELKKILGKNFEVYSLEEKGITSLPEETGQSFEENAEIKALSAVKASGITSVADDSGLYVYALDGAPGIYSARYSGDFATDEKNNELLLLNMDKIEDRRAKFVCAIALIYPNGEKIIVRGECEGTIAREKKGSFGFGYDPLFYLDEYKQTMSEIPSEIKNKISHRAKALNNLIKELEKKGL